MSSDPQVDRCLRAIRELLQGLNEELAAMPPEAWDAETNCPPWRVRDLIAHIITSGDGFAASIQQGLAGSVEPSISHAERDRRTAALAAGDPATAGQAVAAITDAFEALYAGLDEAGLEMIAFHRRGNRSVRWYAYHRLAEVAFHCWDLQTSFGLAPAFDEEVALLLLPTMLESNAPRTYAAGLSAQRGTGERYGLAVAGNPSARWLVTVHPDTLAVERGAGAAGAQAEVTVTGSAAALALLLYGRRELRDLFQAQEIRLDGDALVAERFGAVFPRP